MTAENIRVTSQGMSDERNTSGAIPVLLSLDVQFVNASR